MIQRETVFVLGAGASRPFGFPTGQGLRAQICAEIGGDGSPLSQRLAWCHHDRDKVTNFGQAFKLSGISSIDSFLALNPHMAEIGRHAIVAALLPYQREDSIYQVRGDGNELLYANSDWYQYLYDAMRQGARGPEDIVSNPITFITFNYDLSLERFFYNALKHGFNLHETKALEYARKLRIRHVYGSLAAHDGRRFHYPHEASGEEICEIALNLRVMPNERPDEDPECAEALRDASTVFFLGFGYDLMNCCRLGTANALAPRSSPRVCLGTALGMREAEQLIARQHLGNPRIRLYEQSCLEMLRNNVALLVDP